MKKIFFAIFSVALLFTACEKGSLPQLEQNPYRKVMEYTPGEYTMEVPGNLTPDMLYDWISVSQSGNKATFTVKRNTQDIIRRAEFTIAGNSEKAVISQKAHKLDASVTTTIVNQGATQITIGSSLSTSFADDYASWGVIYGKTSDIAAGTDVPQSSAPGKNEVTINGLEEGVDYYFWTYVVSTEGDKIISGMAAAVAPVFVKAGEDIVKIITEAKEFASIRVQGGVSFGALYLGDFAKNKVITGGWNAEFTEQSMDNLTILDGMGSAPALLIAGDNAGTTGLNGSVEVSFFEIRNGKSLNGYGGGVYACGGPITIKNCYIHDNEASDRGGGIAAGKSIVSELYIVNNIIKGNKAAGHGAGISIETGNPNDGEPPYNYVQIVSNLIIDNISTARDGYASSIYTAYSVDVQIVNNTITGNMNWNEYGGAYVGFKVRDSGRVCMVNNLVVGNLCSDCHKEDPTEAPVYYRQERHIDVSGAKAGIAYNIFEGNVGGLQNCVTNEANEYMTYNFNLTDVMSASYQPAGKALGFGTLGSVNYASLSYPDDVQTCNVSSILEKFNKDMAGNTRVVDGKVDAGCYQAQ